MIYPGSKNTSGFNWMGGSHCAVTRIFSDWLHDKFEDIRRPILKQIQDNSNEASNLMSKALPELEKLDIKPEQRELANKALQKIGQAVFSLMYNDDLANKLFQIFDEEN